MSIPQNRQLRALYELAQAPLTISDIKESVIPSLIDISEDLSKGCNSQIVIMRAKKFKADIEHIKSQLKDLEWHAEKDIKDLLEKIHEAPSVVGVFTNDTMYWELYTILARLKTCTMSSASGALGGTDHKPDAQKVERGKLAMESNPFFEWPIASRQLAESYELLDPLHKACLLCFSAFSEGAEISKRTVIYWWIGENLINLPAGKDGEKEGHEILNIFVEHGFVEHVITKDRVTNRCKVRPFVRSVLVYIAKTANFFDYLVDRESHHDYTSYGNKKHRVCLAKAAQKVSSQTSSSSLQHLRRSRTTDLERIETLINVDKCYLDIKLHWFSKMKNIEALYLGRSDSKAIQHIEVKSCKFLAGLTQMTKLTLLSLQGIAKITRLPDSIKNLKSLRILDLRDCQDLEELPEAIKFLEQLTHMDLKGCYSLAYLPKGLSYLKELQVLKGFIIRESRRQKMRDSCSFHDLSRLKMLRKLSISSLRSFPTEADLKVFSDMQELRKLTITWRGLYRAEISKVFDHRPPDGKKFLEGLEKLDLQHIPYTSAPVWLEPDMMQNLKKLYIKGGKFLKNLDHVGKFHSKVETLRLLHLPELGDPSDDCSRFLRNLRYLEIVGCPKLSTLLPCNDEGVWQCPRYVYGNWMKY